MTLHCDTLVVHCIDYRLQDFLNKWMENNLPTQSYDRVAIAGGVKDIFYIMGQADVAVRLHSIERVILINHEDCGAYGSAGNYNRHKTDLEEAKRKINALFPDLDIELFYLHLNGEFEKM